MSRRRQTVLYIVLIFTLSFFYMRIMDRYLTPRAVFNACEKGLHYGPSEEILLEHRKSNNEVTIIGRCGDGLSSVQVERKMFFLWGIAPGMITGLVMPKDDSDILILYSYDGLVFGRVYDDNITSIEGYAYDIITKEVYFEFNTGIDNGFFYKNTEHNDTLREKPIGFIVYGRNNLNKDSKKFMVQ